MEHHKLDKILDRSFKNTNEWLKFAEQKNATLLILNGGIVWGVARIIANFDCIPTISVWANTIGYFCIVLSVLVCIVSFLPVLQVRWFKPDEKNEYDNCLFFEDIAKYTSVEYLKLLNNKLNLNINEFSKYEIDLSSQITTNSEIASDKYKRFKLASILTIFAVVAFLFSIGGCLIKW